MANYLKATDFASKDDLLSGDPQKIIKGTELDDEFSSIQTAVNSKANSLDVTEAIESIYPIGSIYMNASVSTNPSALLGFGTWVSFGAGRVLVGVDGSDALFDAVEETGGSKDAIVVSHTHTGTTSTNGDHSHTYSYTGYASNAECCGGNYFALPSTTQNTSTAGAHDHTFTTSSSGSSGSNANLQPYITVYMWKRTA